MDSHWVAVRLTNFQPQLQAAYLAMSVLNRTHSDSVSPAFLGMKE